MVRFGEVGTHKSLTEAGFFSVLFVKNDRENKDNQEILLNYPTGTLVRTKMSHANEGGYNKGFAVVDDPIVVDQLKPVSND